MASVELTAEELLGPLNDVEKKNAPRRLFVVGDRSLLASGARVSVVGSRRASARGLAMARGLAEALVPRGVVVISGLAGGIDTATHEATIGAGGRTIAVIGTSLDEYFPAANRTLQDRIAREHLLISQFEPGTPIRRGNFPMRNRTMALISDATVIVEAGERSGSLHQGWEALRLGRPLFIMDSLFSNYQLSWPQEMGRYGAQVLPATNLDILFEFLPVRTRGDAATFAF
jgi:DNA processing protein